MKLLSHSRFAGLEATAETVRLALDYSEAMRHYMAGQFAAARDGFVALLRNIPSSEKSTMAPQLFNQCQEYITKPPVDFDGVFRTDEK
jgi:TolA-binding protein